MSAGRRGLVLSVAFVGLAVWLCPNKPAHAQQPGGFRPVTDPQVGRHVTWGQPLTPEQIRAFLAKFGQEQGKEADWFEEMLLKAVKDRNPDANDEQAKAAIKRLMADKEFMNRVMDLAQKHKNQMPNNGNNGNNAKPPQFSREDLAKLAKLRPEGPGGDPFKVQEEFPPFDPRNPQFDPKRFPAVDPADPPKFDPDTKFPLDPKTGRPMDPRNGLPIDPKNPPRIDPAPADPAKPVIPPQGGPPGADPVKPAAPPNADPKGGRPGEPPNEPAPKGKFDPENPFGEPKESPEKVAKTKAAEAATALWEKNVGPIEETPAVKRAILDLVSDSDAMDALSDGKGNNFFDFLQNAGDDDKFGKLFGDGGNDTGWEWPKFDFNWNRGRDTDFDIGSGRSRERSSSSGDGFRPRGGSSLDGLGGFNFGGMTVPWLLVLIILALVVAAVVWWKWGAILAAATGTRAAGAGPAPWPIDPREINTREDVVKAFEFLSVLLCGPAAKTWTHSTIADELAVLAETHGETAVKLARLYELARYAPLDEPLTRAELLEARRLACDLAGVDEA